MQSKGKRGLISSRSGRRTESSIKETKNKSALHVVTERSGERSNTSSWQRGKNSNFRSLGQIPKGRFVGKSLGIRRRKFGQKIDLMDEGAVGGAVIEVAEGRREAERRYGGEDDCRIRLERRFAWTCDLTFPD